MGSCDWAQWGGGNTRQQNRKYFSKFFDLLDPKRFDTFTKLLHIGPEEKRPCRDPPTLTPPPRRDPRRAPTTKTRWVTPHPPPHGGGNNTLNLQRRYLCTCRGE